MSAVLIVAQIFALRAVVGFISFSLLLIELEATTAAILLLTSRVRADFNHLKKLKKLLDLMEFTRPELVPSHPF